MTLEEIFHAYEFNLRHGFVNNADKYREQIIATLRAGQAMRDTFDIIGDTTEVNHKALARKGSAYDKLMKGDEG